MINKISVYAMSILGLVLLIVSRVSLSYAQGAEDASQILPTILTFIPVFLLVIIWIALLRRASVSSNDSAEFVAYVNELSGKFNCNMCKGSNFIPGSGGVGQVFFKLGQQSKKSSVNVMLMVCRDCGMVTNWIPEKALQRIL